ncbi:hypothetical protein NQ314_018330 [Rhamnusium bicolor]|uniref:Lipase n=1 Tax=Rhamnusium bicolor TaxID=1586634 RepID=A0AAV8WQK3_9CUCU|nr:hypothetical protein NQ314_018330 [Rhamnusium bicolor]
MVKSYGYPVESFEVQTEDGYILDLFRIPNGIQKRSKRLGDQFSFSSSSSSEGKGKRVVFMMHGLMSNSESFIYGGPSQSLAFWLADTGYDVFLGNARGSIYGQKHTTLDPQKDSAFWRFCWEEIGTKDLPALIDKALSVSGQTKLSYIGHNEGTTSFFVLGSERPEYNKKLDRQISLGPLVFMKNSNAEVFKNIQQHLNTKSWLMKNLGINAFAPTHELVEEAESKCMSKQSDELICKNIYFLINGYNSKQFNQTTIKQFISRVPSTASVKEVMHFVQLRASGRFQKYSNTTQGNEFDLSKVVVPVALFYTPDDQLYSSDDVQLLAGKLPNLYKLLNFEKLNNNLDFLYSENLNNVHEQVWKALKEDTEKQNEVELGLE